MSTSDFTKERIAQGVKTLLQTMEFEQISVGLIARHCHISRNTFYYHFKDKYDIISWIFYREVAPPSSAPPSQRETGLSPFWGCAAICSRTRPFISRPFEFRDKTALRSVYWTFMPIW